MQKPDNPLFIAKGIQIETKHTAYTTVIYIWYLDLANLKRTTVITLPTKNMTCDRFAIKKYDLTTSY